jgi:hypothetical protein
MNWDTYIFIQTDTSSPKKYFSFYKENVPCFSENRVGLIYSNIIDVTIEDIIRLLGPNIPIYVGTLGNVAIKVNPKD